MGTRRGGGKSKPSPPPPSKKKFFGNIGGFFATFSLYGALFATFFSFLGAFSPCGSLFATFYFMVGAFLGAFLRACPPPLRKFLRAPMIARRVREHAPRNFFVWPQFSEFWTCFVTILP